MMASRLGGGIKPDGKGQEEGRREQGEEDGRHKTSELQ